MAVTGKNGFYEKHTAAADIDGATRRLAIRKIIWSGYTNASHTLQVKNGVDDIVIPEFAAGAAGGPPIILDFENDPLIINGVETDVLGSGTVVYLYK